MKITYEFDSIEEREMLEIFQNASKLHSAMCDFSQDVLRQMDKYGCINGREMTEQEHIIVDHIREEFYRILREHDVSLV